MKKIALGMALGASLLSTAAMAAEQRPTYMRFSAPVAAAATVAPAAPVVGKRDEGFGTIPLFVPLVGGLVILGFVAAFATGNGHNGSPG